MFHRTTLIALSLACVFASSAQAGPKKEAFVASWSAQQKFDWAQRNHKAYCSIPRSDTPQFDDLPGWMQMGLGWATEGMVVNAIKESCGKDLSPQALASYRPN